MIQYMNIFILYIIWVISYNTSYAYAPLLSTKNNNTNIYNMSHDSFQKAYFSDEAYEWLGFEAAE